MKINELRNYKIYQDLDGCLVDFDAFAEQNIGFTLKDANNNKSLKKEFWKQVNIRTTNNIPFYGAMEPMPDAFVLWSYIKKYDPIILSATGRVKNAHTEKLDWISRYLGEEYVDTAILTSTSAEKARYADSKSILIDDRDKSINPWIEAGGIGILHKSANDTIKRLQELGL